MNLKKIGLALVVATLASACTLKSARIPTAAIPFAEADYQVLGKTKAETCSAYILGIDWGHLFSNQSANVPIAGGLPIPILGGGTPEERRAMFMALEKMPKATHLLEPRFEGSAKGLLMGRRPIFGERCATVHAHGVQIAEKPFSRLND